MTYDNNGNMTSVTNSCGTTTYDWDVRNRLVGIDGYKPDCSPLTATFEYDALGRRIEKTVNSRTIQYLYDGLDIVQEIENGVVTTNYIRTLNIDEPLARIKADGTVRYYQADALGSIIAFTDESGAIKTQYTYDPYGNVTITGEPSDNPFQYTGRENDVTGLYYYRARYYSPDLQRFISEDPIKLVGGINPYAYVGNDPMNWIDPYGLQLWKSLLDKIVRKMPKWLRDKLGLDPMTPEDIIKELADKEIDRLKKVNPNDPRIKELEDLKKEIDNKGLPGYKDLAEELLKKYKEENDSSQNKCDK